MRSPNTRNYRSESITSSGRRTPCAVYAMILEYLVIRRDVD